MVHKSSIIPGFSKFIDENVLAHYPPTSMKRILMAGAVSLYLKQNEGLVDTLTSNPMVCGLGICHENGMIDLEPLKTVFKNEINKAGFMRLTIPLVGDVDFTTEDVDALYNIITEVNTQINNIPNQSSSTVTLNNTGVY